MSPEGLLTILGVALAVYALLPAERQLDFRTRLSLLDWVVIIGALLVVHVILFLPVLQKTGMAPAQWTWPLGFTPETTSYVILAVATAVITVRITMGRLGRTRLPQFRELIERLLQQRRFADVAFLLERHLSVLTKASKGGYLLSRLKRHLDPPLWLAFLNAQKGTSNSRWYHGRVARAIAYVLPGYAAASGAATDVLRRLLVYQPFIRELATIRPYLGIEIVRSGIDAYSDFQTIWLDALLDDAHSVLYYEIQDNQAIAGGHRYKFNPSNRLVSFYFTDPHNAERFAVYKPLGDHLLADLRRRVRTPDTDRYNQPLDDFYEVERWRDPTHAVLRMFDFMIPEAMHHGISWHMWLFYLPSFVEAFDRNLQPVAGVDPNREWPTPYHFFIYEAISSLRDWFLEVRELDVNNPNRVMDDTTLNVDRANITKCAALALGQACRTVLASSGLTRRFKAYILEVCLLIAERLTRDGSFAPHRELLLSSVANGGSGYVPDMAAHHRNVAETLQSIDLIMRHEVGDELLSLRSV